MKCVGEICNLKKVDLDRTIAERSDRKIEILTRCDSCIWNAEIKGLQEVGVAWSVALTIPL